MGIYKEAAHFLEDVAKHQEAIFPGQSEKGIPVSSHRDPLCIKIKRAIEDKDLFGSLKKHRKEFRNDEYVKVIVTFYLPWEALPSGSLSCSRWDIIFVRNGKKNKTYLKFVCKRVAASKKLVWGDV